MRDQLTAKAPQTPFSKPQILSSFGVFGALAVPYLDTHGLASLEGLGFVAGVAPMELVIPS
jgi:hypothetical protein